jgi:hypothetical protein
MTMAKMSYLILVRDNILAKNINLFIMFLSSNSSIIMCDIAKIGSLYMP